MVVGSYCHGNLPAQRASPIGHNPVENKLVPWCEEIGLAFSSERGSTRRSQAHSCRDKQRYLGGSIVRTVVVIVLNCYGCPHPANFILRHKTPPVPLFFARLGGTLCAFSGCIWHTSCPFYCNSLPRLRFLRTEDAVEPDHIHPEPCPRCGGVLVFKDTVECPTTGSPVNFFRCDDCGYVHSVERQSA